MRLPGLSRFIPNKQKHLPPQEFVALQIGKAQSKAAIWVNTPDITIKELIKGESPRVVLEKALKSTPATQLIFGLADDYVEENAIKKSYLPELKQIADEAHLSPLGFVVIHEAIANLLGKEHEAPQTCLLIGFEPAALQLSLYRGGVCKSTASVARTNNLFSDVEMGLEFFSTEEILPSKIVLYNEGKELDEIREQLLSYPWQQNNKFLHVPKIEALPWEYSIKAIVYAGVSELSTSASFQTIESYTPQMETISAPIIETLSTLPSEDKPPAEQQVKTISDIAPDDETQMISDNEADAPTPHINDHVSTVSPQDYTTAVDETLHSVQDDPIISDEDSMGFVTDTDVLHPSSPPRETPIVSAHIPQQEPIHADHPVSPRPSRGIKLPSIRPPHSLAIPGPKALIPLAILLIVLLGGLGTLTYMYPKASVDLLAEPKILESEVEVTLNTSIDTPDPDSKQIPGRVHSITVSGTKSTSASGEKTIGEKAKGSITIVNKTTQSKKLAAGTVLSASSQVAFTLDEDVTIASASDTGESLAYGKTTVNATASKIGPSGNIKKDTELSLKDYGDSQLSAKSSQDFSGGTEREITIVSQNDLDNLESELATNLTTEARDKMKGQVLGSETFLADSLSENIVDKTFDKKPGDESDNVSLELNLEISQTSYREEDIKELLNSLMKEQVTNGFTLDTNKSYVTVLSTKEPEKDSNEVTFTASYTAFLLPDLDTSNLNQELAGKSTSDLTDYISKLTDKNIVGYEIYHDRKLPFYPNLPLRPENLTVRVVPY